ncbi:FAD:protein FMN transferase [Mangrovimonas aestuarii]|uniref:FAD:protein FMN transferase n=1 Tax=Mangrovimonas aestuarii TaxID=3018443 RepID=UPI00237A03E8|nr:FAD:protein FMN transferase [Mangrovimonas aestuarii]
MKKYIVLAILAVTILACKKESKPVLNKVSGPVFGTTYSIQYATLGEIDYARQFDSLFAVINNSMSTYDENSIISKLNDNRIKFVDDHFINVITKAKEVYKETDGAFDPTIGVLVNAWDFGPEGKVAYLDSAEVENLMKRVGFGKVLIRHNEIIKTESNMFLDFNAIAKGYGVDVIADYLESKNVSDYLVEVGGEIRAKGMNIEKNSNWKVGIEDPNFDGSQSVMKAVSMHDGAMATSGTYRKFKVDENGNRYAHIIDTKTGYPSKTNLLSISVMADDCMTADAYATAFKAMGIEKVKQFLKRHPELKVFLIFENEDNEFETLSLNGFPEA